MTNAYNREAEFQVRRAAVERFLREDASRRDVVWTVEEFCKSQGKTEVLSYSPWLERQGLGEQDLLKRQARFDEVWSSERKRAAILDGEAEVTPKMLDAAFAAEGECDFSAGEIEILVAQYRAMRALEPK